MQQQKVEKEIPLSDSIDRHKKGLEYENNDAREKAILKMEKKSRECSG